MKKKAEFSTLAEEVEALKKENKDLHEKVRLESNFLFQPRKIESLTHLLIF